MTRIVWNPKVNYHVDDSLPLIPILSQTNPVHTLRSYFLARVICGVRFMMSPSTAALSQRELHLPGHMVTAAVIVDVINWTSIVSLKRPPFFRSSHQNFVCISVVSLACHLQQWKRPNVAFECVTPLLRHSEARRVPRQRVTGARGFETT